MEVATSKVGPRLLKVAQLAGENLYEAGLVDRLLPRQRDIPVGIALKECECLDDDRNGSMELCTGAVQSMPPLRCLLVQRISRQRKGDPRPAINESCLPLPHQGSS